MKYFSVNLLTLFLIISVGVRAQSVETRVASMLSQMTLDEKIGQMTLVNYATIKKNYSDITTYYIGSVLSGGGENPYPNNAIMRANVFDTCQSYALKSRLKIPIIYGIDAVHGNSNLNDAVIFPHNIGLGCMFDTAQARKAFNAVCEEVVASGMNWNYAPCIAVSKNERWGRTYESFGENTAEVTDLAGIAVKCFQGDSLGSTLKILACAKHYIGDGATDNGTNEGNVSLDEATFRAKFLPPYIRAIQSGVGSIMVSHNKFNGEYMHGSKYWITTVLKNELGFKGIVVSDWAGIDRLNTVYKEAINIAINAGMDMVMVPSNYKTFIQNLKALVTEGKVPVERIDDAVRRILTVKYKMGLFEKPYANKTLQGKFGGAEHRETARECVRKSVVLLKNDSKILPLSKNVNKILVSGSKSDDIGIQCGGWTISWQGGSGNTTTGTSLLTAIKNAALQATVTYSADGSGSSAPDVNIVVVGETPYAETNGDRTDLHLSAADVNVINNAALNGAPVVCLIISGRPMIIDNIIDKCQSVMAVWLPGTEGAGVADVLFGDYSPTGKLSMSWPRTMSQIPVNVGDLQYDPLFPYKFGLEYSKTDILSVSTNELKIYPNPATDYIRLQSELENQQVDILNSTGSIIATQQLKENAQKINVSTLPTGFYLLRVKGNSMKTGKFRIVR